MTTNLATTTNNSNGNSEWGEEDIKLIKDTVAKETTDSEFKLFLYTAAKYGLDPLIRQIWCIKYGTQPAAIFTSRDGFLSIAHRSSQFDGMETKAVRDENGKLTGAVCKVWRKDMTHPFTVEVALSEYNTGKRNWLTMPETMLKKVAESQALRKAFDLSGLYEPAEYTPNAEATEITNTTTGEIVNTPPNNNSKDRGKYLPVSTKNYEEFKWELEQVQTLEALENVAGRIKRSGLIPNQLEMLRVHHSQAKKRIEAAAINTALALEPKEEPEEAQAKEEGQQEYNEGRVAAVEIFGGNPR